MLHKLLLALVALAVSATVLAAPRPSLAQNPCGASTPHVVQTGENLFRIGLRYGYTTDQLAAFNGIVDVNSIQIGQIICIPTGGNTGGPIAQPSDPANPPTAPGATGQLFGGTVFIENGRYNYELAQGTTQIVVPEGTFDDISGFSTTATVTVDAMNNVVRVSSARMIPNAQARVFISTTLGDISGGVAGYIMADQRGLAEGFIVIPYTIENRRHYVMIRAYDGRMTFGFFDYGRRFP